MMSIGYPLVFDYTLYNNLLFKIQTFISHVKKYETLCNVTCQRILDGVVVLKGEILDLTLGSYVFFKEIFCQQILQKKNK